MNNVTAYAADVKIGKLGLRPGHKFLYLFDFGSNHLFRVVLT